MSLSLLRLVLFLNDAAKDGDIAIVVVWSSPLDEGGMQVRARVFPVLQKKKDTQRRKEKTKQKRNDDTHMSTTLPRTFSFH